MTSQDMPKLKSGLLQMSIILEVLEDIQILIYQLLQLEKDGIERLLDHASKPEISPSEAEEVAEDLKTQGNSLQVQLEQYEEEENDQSKFFKA